MKNFPNDNWTRVEIFLRAWDRLPEGEGDIIDRKTLDMFCKKWKSGRVITKTVDLEQIYKAIKNDKVILSKDL